MERHAPASAADLVVHKKKVAEVRAWLQAQWQPGRPRGASRLLLVSGATSIWREQNLFVGKLAFCLPCWCSCHKALKSHMHLLPPIGPMKQQCVRRMLARIVQTLQLCPGLI